MSLPKRKYNTFPFWYWPFVRSPSQTTESQSPIAVVWLNRYGNLTKVQYIPFLVLAFREVPITDYRIAIPYSCSLVEPLWERRPIGESALFTSPLASSTSAPGPFSPAL